LEKAIKHLYIPSLKLDGPALLMKYHEHNGSPLELCKASKEQLLSEKQMLQIFVDLCNTLIDLHSNRIVHCDLHCGNILLDATFNPIIINFGRASSPICKRMSFGDTENPKRCPRYMWRSMYTDVGKEFDEKADIFAFGYIVQTVASDYIEGRKENIKEKLKSIANLVKLGRSISEKFTPLCEVKITLEKYKELIK
jgi:serine/threonine protein kinase